MKHELVADLVKVSGLQKVDVLLVLEGLSKNMHAEMAAGRDFTIPGVGKFKVNTRSARKVTLPHSENEIDVPARKMVGFKAVKELRDRLNGA